MQDSVNLNAFTVHLMFITKLFIFIKKKRKTSKLKQLLYSQVEDEQSAIRGILFFEVL